MSVPCNNAFKYAILKVTFHNFNLIYFGHLEHDTNYSGKLTFFVYFESFNPIRDLHPDKEVS